LWNVGKVASLAVIGVELGWVGSFTASGTARHGTAQCHAAQRGTVPCRAGCSELSERTYPTQLNAYDSQTSNLAYVPQAERHAVYVDGDWS